MKIVILIATVFLVLTLSACTKAGTDYSGSSKTESVNNETISTSENKPEAKYRKISAADGKERLDTEKGIILLDVRTIEENEETRIPGSLLIPLDSLDAKAPELLKDKASTIFVYCRSGRRSSLAAEQLISLGYTNVYDMGGIIDWPYETETGKDSK